MIFHKLIRQLNFNELLTPDKSCKEHGPSIRFIGLVSFFILDLFKLNFKLKVY